MLWICAPITAVLSSALPLSHTVKVYFTTITMLLLSDPASLFLTDSILSVYVAVMREEWWSFFPACTGAKRFDI